LWESLFLSGSGIAAMAGAMGRQGPVAHGAVRRPLVFDGQLAQLQPHLESVKNELCFTHQLTLPGGERHPLSEVRFFAGPSGHRAGGEHFLHVAQRAAG
jgi:hypothetical protein